jgi:esterase/lipase
MKTLRGFSVFFLILGSVYLVGPRVDNPELNIDKPSVPNMLLELEEWVNYREFNLGNVRSGNASKIIFNNSDSIPKKTRYSVLYLHGFSASGMEGDPVHRDIAKSLGANLYIPRLFGHGLKETEPMLDFNNISFWESGKEALEIAKQLGEKVIVLGTSHGGSLSLSLGTDPSIAAIALFSPNIEVFDYKAKLLSKPWGLQIARIIKGGNYNYLQSSSEDQKKYWTTKYRLEATTHMQKFLDVKMRRAIFKKVNVPVFLGYYYKNDSLQDQVVSVSAMLKMYDQLGTPEALKVKKAFPEAGNHVISSSITTKIYDEVTLETLKFLKKSLKI